jgi:hypothetical protein
MQKYPNNTHFILLLPLLIITMVLVNQTDKLFILIGQITGWLSYVFAGLTVYNSFKNKLWIYLLFLLIITTKALAIVSGLATIETTYIVCQNTLFCVAGTIIAFLKPNLVYKQIMVFCILNVILAILQVTGLGGKLAMILTTHGEGSYVTPVITFFKNEADFNYLLIQGRPAGLTQANVILSLFIIFAIAIHFSRQYNVFKWGTPLLSLLITLSMAKMAYFGFIISGLIILMWGQRFQKLRILRALILLFIFLIIYSILFPGLASVNLSKETIDASIFLRANDIMFALNPEYLIGANRPFFEGTRFFYSGEEGEFVSGIASVLAKVFDYLSLFVTGMVLLVLLYIYGLRKLKLKFPSIRLKTINVLVIICIFPVTNPIWPFQIYWFMLGYGLLPFYFYLHPRFIDDQIYRIRNSF